MNPSLLFSKFLTDIIKSIKATEKIQLLDSFKQTIKDQQYGFFSLENYKDWVSKVEETYTTFKSKKHIVHIGIGGSSLGPKMLIDALGTNSPRSFFFLDNVDPDLVQKCINSIDIKDTLFLVVSKSGGTLETLSLLSVILNQLKNAGIAPEKFSSYFVSLTANPSGQLALISKEYDISTILIPDNIGGRYSVLTAVGLLPARFAEIEISDFFNSFLDYRNSILNAKAGDDLSTLALVIHHLLKNENISETVLMPYHSHLKSFSEWFVQLWAESLGKKESISGQTIHTGLTPISAVGATDQHSQMQLFKEGPKNKLILFIEVNKFQNEFDLSQMIDSGPMSQLGSKKLSEILKAEFEGTIQALDDDQRHHIRISIANLSPNTLSCLILMLESLTVMVGKRLDINPFDQPGVEAAKIYAIDWLNK